MFEQPCAATGTVSAALGSDNRKIISFSIYEKE